MSYERKIAIERWSERARERSNKRRVRKSVCVCVCVCERETKKGMMIERELVGQSTNATLSDRKNESESVSVVV